MIYRRIPLKSSPSGAFAYVLAMSEDATSIQIGVGHESISGLNLTHYPTFHIKAKFAHEVADKIERDGVALKTGRLAEMFHDAQTLDYLPSAYARGSITQRIAQAVREVHDEAWGHPADWDVRLTSLLDGRLIWIAYDSTIDKIRIGIGYYDEGNNGVLGDESFAIGKRFAGDFAADLFTKPNPLLFFAKPARWPLDFSPIVGLSNKKRLAVDFLRLADEVWGPVKATERRALTDAEIAALNAGQ